VVRQVRREEGLLPMLLDQRTGSLRVSLSKIVNSDERPVQSTNALAGTPVLGAKYRCTG